jgi:hypothetical protein
MAYEGQSIEHGREGVRSEQEARKERLFGILHPQSESTELNNAIAMHLLEGSTRKEKIQEALAAHGYDFDALEAKGREAVQEMIKLADVDESALTEEEKERLAMLAGLVYVSDESGDTGIAESYRIGLRGELSRQARKLLLASLENDQEEEAAIMTKNDAVVGGKEVDQFLEVVRDNPDAFLRRKAQVINGIADPQKKLQYEFVAGLLE